MQSLPVSANVDRNNNLSTQHKQLLSWLKSKTGSSVMPFRIHTDSSRIDDDYVSVAIYVGGEVSAIDKALLMQEIEDEWNYATPRPRINLLLVPTKD